MSRPNKQRVLEVIRQDDIDFIDHKASSMRMDAGILSTGTGYFFKRQLEHIFENTLEANIPEPNFSKFFPLDTSISEGAKAYTQRLMEPVGEAKIIGNFGDDLPRVNVVRREERRAIQMLGDSYGYSVQDIMAARFSGEPLDSDLGFAAREAIERKHNRLCWYGDLSAQLWGVLDHPYVPRSIFTEPLSAAATSSDAIINQVNAMINGVNSLTKTTAQVNRVGLPPAEYTYIHSARIPDTNITIAEFILKAHADKGLQFLQAWELDADENDGQALAIAYRQDIASVKYVAPITFRQLPVERRNLEFVVNNLGSSGGFYPPRPLEMVVGELLRS